MALEINIYEENGIVSMEISGKIDSITFTELKKGFDQTMKQGKKNILLNMRDLSYIDSTGIGAVLSFAKWIDRIGGKLKIAEMQPKIKEVFNLLSFDRILDIYDSASEAKKTF